jgi:16S rRNA (cytosine967-C5)-methyltransferase
VGIVRRHPDIRLLRQDADIPALAKQQRRLLEALWPLLRPGGRLLYATCSIFREENEIQVEGFMQRHADCVEVTPNTVQWGEKRPFGRQILTGDQDMDGFYYALLEKAEA